MRKPISEYFFNYISTVRLFIMNINMSVAKDVQIPTYQAELRSDNCNGMHKNLILILYSNQEFLLITHTERRDIYNQRMWNIYQKVGDNYKRVWEPPTIEIKKSVYQITYASSRIPA